MSDSAQPSSGELVTSLPLDPAPIPPQPTPPAFEGALPRGLGLFLAYPAPDDRAAYVALREASRAHNRPWEPLRPGDDDEQMFRRMVADANTERSQRMFARLQATREIAAQLTLSRVRPGPTRTAYLGYWTGAAYARRGIATRAVLLALDHAFDNCQLHRVEANVQPHNEPSIRLVNRLGFREEGLCRKYLQIAGEWCDHIRFSMLEEEWPARRSEAIASVAPD